jgi:hypothetical protein
MFFLLICSVTISGCGMTPFSSPMPGEPDVIVQPAEQATLRPLPRPGTRGGPLGAVGQPADALDRTTPQERSQARGDSTGGLALGRTLASLGSPSEQGFWLRTGLVTRVQGGRVDLADGGGSIRVELRPSGTAPEAGSQLSLAAFRALDVPLTQLVPLRVFAD